MVALLLTVPHEWGRLISDNRYVFYAQPSNLLRQLLAAWDPKSDLGGPPAGYAPVTLLFSTILRTVGLPPWLVERIYHAALLAIGGIGTGLLARRLEPRSNALPLVSGLLFMTAPFTMSFLLPSWLFQNAALCPWLLLAAIAGCTGASRWRYAALFALAVAAAGSLNLPGLVWATLPIVPAIAVLLVGGETTVRKVVAWAVRAGGLALLVLLPAVVRAGLGAGALGRNLQTTETVAAVSQSSSWSESTRGLGSWLLYWNPVGRLLYPYLSLYFTRWWVVLLTFVPALAAVATVAFTRWRPRVMLGSIMVVCTTAMVGAYPFRSPSPGGAALLRLYQTSAATVGLRNTYKAGAGLLVATSILAAFGLIAALRRVRASRRWLRDARAAALTMVLVMVAAAVMVAGAWPLLSGTLYRTNPGFDQVPGYWNDAAAWLNEQPDDGRVAIYPGSPSTSYRWGSVGGGDLFPATFTRAFTVSTAISNSAPDAANLLASLDEYVTSGTYRPGTYAPIARRLGIRYVVIRNDLDWASSNSPRPATLSALREDRDLVRVAAFGATGQNVLAAGDTGPLAQYESELPPVEIYEVSGYDGQTRAVEPGASAVVAGDGAAWPGLAATGDLDAWTPVQYSGRLDGPAIDQAMASGSTVLVTDTNRKRQIGFSSSNGYTLPEQVTTRVGGLFARPGSQSVATYGDAASIDTVNANNLIDPGAANRPAAAFDGNQWTAWRTGAAVPLRGQGLEVTLREPHRVDRVTVAAAAFRAGDRRVTDVEVILSDGQRRSIDLRSGVGYADFLGRAVTGFQVVITAIEGSTTGPFGLAEVSVPGLDLNEVIQVPDDIRREAAINPELESSLRTGRVEYRFERLQSVPVDEESSLDRRFWVIGPRTFDASGSIGASNSTPDSLLAELTPTAVSATATGRWDQRLSGSGLRAVDDDLQTGWQIVPGTGKEAEGELDALTVTMFQRPVSSVEVILDGNTIDDTTRVLVSSGEDVRSVDVAPDASCPGQGAGSTCPISVTVGLPAAPRTEIKVAVVDQAGLARTNHVGVLEVRPNGVPNPGFAEQVPGDCRSGLVEVDGVDVPVRLTGTTAALLDGDDLDLEACDPLTLDDGWHTVLTGWQMPVDSMRVRASDLPPSPPQVAASPVTVDRGGASSMTVGHADDPDLRLLSGWGATPGWKASGGAVPVELDTQAAWVLPGGSDTTKVTFGPNFAYRIAVGMSIVGLLLAVALLLRDPRKGNAAEGDPRRASAWWADAVLLAAATAITGVAGLIVAGLAVVAIRRRLLGARELAFGALVLLALAALATIPPLGAALTPLNPSWPADRQLAHTAAKLAAVLLSSAIVAAIHRWPSRSSSVPTDGADVDDAATLAE